MTTAAIVLAVAVGVGCERRWPTGAVRASRRALLVVLYGLMPVVIFFNTAASKLDVSHGIGLGLAIVAVAGASLLAGSLARRGLGLSRPKTGAVICTVLCVNTGYLGYPLTVALLGRDQLATAVLYDVMVTGPCLMLGAFAVGAAFGTRSGEGPRARAWAFVTRNPPLYAAVAGLLAPRALAPTALVDASQALVIAILPLGFFAVGATLAENAEHGDLPMPPRLTRPVALAVASRLVLAPALLIALAAPVVHLPSAYRLQAAMPCGLASMIVAHAYGLDMEITAEAVTWSTVIVILVALGSLLL